MKPCLFVHVPKTGGTSMRAALEKERVDRIVRISGHKHETAAELRARQPDYAERFSFAFVRNPYARVLSRYFQNPPSRGMKQRPVDFEAEVLANGKLVPSACEMIEIDGERAVDYVGRFETLEPDWAWVCDCLELEPESEPPGRPLYSARVLPQVNRAYRGYPPWQQFYESIPRARAHIAELYASDFERFGYAA